MTKKLKTPYKKPAPLVRRWYKLEELQAIALESGYDLTNPPKRKVFVLTNVETGAWGWVINPATENIVQSIRDLTREEWRAALDFNIKRLDEEASEK
ncbi:hypothetical protein UXN85_20880 [Enterobacter hormaechei]